MTHLEAWEPWEELGQNSLGPQEERWRRSMTRLRKPGWILQGGSGSMGLWQEGAGLHGVGPSPTD